MKKYILITLMITAILLSGCNSDKLADDENKKDNEQLIEEKDPNVGKYDVNFYLFYSSSCSHCHSEREWIASIRNEYSYVNFKMYEVSENQELFEKVTKAYGSSNISVPVTIIGNNYMVGYSDTKNRKFIRYFKDLSTFENCDVVQAIIDNGDVESCMAQNER